MSLSSAAFPLSLLSPIFFATTLEIVPFFNINYSASINVIYSSILLHTGV